MRIVIIGAGMAGSKLAEELLLKQPQTYKITLIGEESKAGYNRIMLSSLLANEITPENMALVNVQAMQQSGLEMITGDAVQALQLPKQQVQLASGRMIQYDKLILATGSKARILPIEGTDAANVMGFRTWQDVDSMMDLPEAQSVSVIGGGLLGLEAAVGLVKRGHKVTVFHRSGYLLNRQLDEAAAQLLQTRLESMGIEFRLGESPQGLIKHVSGQVNGLQRPNGEIQETDLVVMAAGIVPEIALAKQAGLHTEQAIQVNEQMATSHADVFAIGECCEFQQHTFGLVAPIWSQIAVLVDVLSDQKAEFSIQPTPTKLKVSGVNVFSVGQIQPKKNDHCLIYQDVGTNQYRKLVVNEGLLVGAILYGNVADGSWYFQLIQNKTNVSDQLDRLIFGEAYCQSKVA
ncbi:NAD(P)/FAD-dependent oxidoreductase [Marinomonas posidonica]|uniref:Nitrite reductase (NAD(P)H) n=1 Tax=Marinomonas posidonica (strain CECT 7376 / NCIMB 14433 / IVIA-Po-181) TaxID=491952 RepID=F6CW00_MARPP|nr:FAD-dependent oxidoreductase [Marinomonas posidonica]AEF54299.1 Nitrite reductase (NAD(P)H) [Marinomonas posidonica IVIA-Po-181]